MITLTDAQTWSVIAILAAAFFGTLTLIASMFTRVVRAEVGGLRSEMVGEMNSLRSEMTSEINSLRSEMTSEINGLRSEMNAGFDVANSRIGDLDRDVQFLMDRRSTI